MTETQNVATPPVPRTRAGQDFVHELPQLLDGMPGSAARLLALYRIKNQVAGTRIGRTTHEGPISVTDAEQREIDAVVAREINVHLGACTQSVRQKHMRLLSRTLNLGVSALWVAVKTAGVVLAVLHFLPLERTGILLLTLVTVTVLAIVERNLDVKRRADYIAELEQQAGAERLQLQARRDAAETRRIEDRYVRGLPDRPPETLEPPSDAMQRIVAALNVLTAPPGSASRALALYRSSPAVYHQERAADAAVRFKQSDMAAYRATLAATVHEETQLVKRYGDELQLHLAAVPAAERNLHRQLLDPKSGVAVPWWLVTVTTLLAVSLLLHSRLLPPVAVVLLGAVTSVAGAAGPYIRRKALQTQALQTLERQAEAEQAAATDTMGVVP